MSDINKINASNPIRNDIGTTSFGPGKFLISNSGNLTVINNTGTLNIDSIVGNSSFQIEDADLNSLANASSTGIYYRSGDGSWNPVTMGSGIGFNGSLFLTNVSSSTPWNNIAYVDANRGNDSTAILGRPDYPYATISSAQTAALSSVVGTGIINILPGRYTDTGLVPADADTTLIYNYYPGSIHIVTGSQHLFSWTGNYTDKTLYILGRGKFTANAGTVGMMISTNYTTTKCTQFHIEAQDIINANGRTTALFDIRSGGIAENGSSIKVHYSLDYNVGEPFYFRIDAKIVYIDGHFIRGINTDGSGRFIITCGYLERLYNAYNSFSTTTTNVFATYRIKSTNTDAITNRRGEVVVMSQKYECTDGAGSIIKIPSNADTANGGCQTTVVGGFMRSWAGGSIPPIVFAATNSLYKLRLHNVHILVENSATGCITCTGAQTIEAIGSLTSNKAIGSDITVRGATPVINTGFWTGF